MIYLASPYKHANPAVMEARFRAVCMAAARLMAKGHVVLSPIAHSHPVATLGGAPQNDWEFWKRQDFAFIERCDEFWIYTLPGWDKSVGIKDELALADARIMRVRYECPTAEELAVVRAAELIEVAP